MATNNVTVGATPTTVVVENPKRIILALVNDSDEAIYLSLGGQAAMNMGIRLNASGGSLVLSGFTRHRGPVSAICASGTKILCIEEL
ncbi:unnamed protein product [marine sediment metagenome]|uniref:Uncharacterized protein n=1 Tax=marine sediment metagenome TaxID=412755 RepID=X1LHS7_9ZZZZ